MSRYINADALMKDIWSLYRDEDHIDYNVAIVDALNVIDEQPTADVVEVVRCKDCIYYENFLCGRFSAYGNSVEEPEYDFCSYGERRTDE